MNKSIKAIAFKLCENKGYLPLALEPGDIPCIDGKLPNGDPGHFIWREFIPLAIEILDLFQPINILLMPNKYSPSAEFIEIETDNGKSINAGEMSYKGIYQNIRITELPLKEDE